jgi:hypothetical protein
MAPASFTPTFYKTLLELLKFLDLLELLELLCRSQLLVL